MAIPFIFPKNQWLSLTAMCDWHDFCSDAECPTENGLASDMSKINTNMAGVTTLYHLRNKEEGLNKALERISSGLRLNHAVDDAAGASIVNRMTSQIKVWKLQYEMQRMQYHLPKQLKVRLKK